MITTRVFLLAAAGCLTASLAACADSSSSTAAKKPERKIYYAHNVQTGSHLQRAYVDPNGEANDTGALTGSTDAGQKPFVGNSAGGSYAGAH